MLALLLLAPCDRAVPVDAGQVVTCSGIIITVDQAKRAVKEREELKVRRAFKCPDCPPCVACPPPPPRPAVLTWALGGVVVGALLSAAVGLVLSY
jgi:hypothetical protein